MKQRLEQFLAAENLSKAQFADRINVARAGITHIMSGRNNPSYEFIVNTMSAFPDLNIEWLLKGTGRMYKSGASETTELGGLFDNSADSPAFEPAAAPSPTSTPAAPVSLQTAALPQTQSPAPAQTQSHVMAQPQAQTMERRSSGISRIVVFFEDGTFRDFC